MLDWSLQPRYWSPRQGYATGDVLVQMVRDGWKVTSLQPAPSYGRAILHIATLRRGEDVLSLLVLDCPVVREIVSGPQ